MAEGTKTVNIETLAKEMGISRPTAYKLAREDRLPVPVIRFPGTNRMVVSRAALDEILAQRKEGATHARA